MWWFGASPPRATPKGLPSSLAQHRLPAVSPTCASRPPFVVHGARPGILSICPIGEGGAPHPTRPARRGAAGGGLRRRIPAMGVIDDYLEDLGDSQRAELERIRRIVLDRVPDAEEGRSYGMPAFRYKRKPLLGFAALKDHLSLFPFSPHVVAAVKGRLAGYDLSKGTIRFTEAKPIPEDVIWEVLDLRLEEIG